MRHRFCTVDVFTDRLFGGNSLAVFPDARALDGEVMQRIAREFNFSETTFVLPAASPAHTRRVRIFTPGTELPFAGHPTLGTAHALAALGEIPLTGETTRIVLEEGVGPVPVTIRAREGRPVFAQLTAARLPEFGPAPPPPEAIASALSLDVADLGEEPPRSVSCGVPFLFVALRQRDALRRARINSAQWEAVFSTEWTRYVHLYCHEPDRAGASLRARMFAPSSGVPEDPATGGAAVALAGLLASRSAVRDGTLRWVIEQGVEMGRPSRLEIEADRRNGEVVATRVGGASVLVTEGTMEIP